MRVSASGAHLPLRGGVLVGGLQPHAAVARARPGALPRDRLHICFHSKLIKVPRL